MPTAKEGTTSPRPDVLLGLFTLARTYKRMYGTGARAVRPQLTITFRFDLSNTLDLDSIKTEHDDAFMQLAENLGWVAEDVAHCIALGLEARRRGVCEDIDFRVYSVLRADPGRLFTLLSPIRATWNEKEGTIQDDAMFRNRYSQFPIRSAELMTCGPDTILFAAIYSGAGIRRCDAISFGQMRGLSTAQKLLRLLLVNKLENIRGAANLFNGVLKGELGLPEDAMMDISTALPLCFESLQSFSFTTVEGYICCDRTFRLLRTTKIHRRAIVPLNSLKSSVESATNAFFGSRVVLDGASCGRQDCENEKKEYFRHVVLDRLPPWLIVSTAATWKGTDPGWWLHESINVRYRTTKRLKRKTYKLKGLIYHVDGNHYIARWEGRDQFDGVIVEYDSTSTTTSLRRAHNWWPRSFTKREATPCAVFYQQVEVIVDTMCV